MFRKYLSILVLAISLALTVVGCGEKSTFNPQSCISKELSYAKGFEVKTNGDYTIITLQNPWDSTAILQKYLLIDKEKELPNGIGKEYTIVRTPLENLAVYTAVDCAILNFLKSPETIKGVCETSFITLDFIQKGLKDGKIVDLGQSTKPNIEKMVVLAPDGVVVSPFQNTGYGAVGKLGIPIIECASYMENTPLGQSEWIKFLGYFVGKSNLADSLFSEIELRYNTIKQRAQSATTKPQLMAGKKFGQAWHMAAGESYMAKIYDDAHSTYPWAETKGKGSLSLSFEQVLIKSSNADRWFIIYYDPISEISYSKLKAEFSLYSKFKPFNKEEIYGCNTLTTSYYERAILAPDLVLQDFVKILHPNILKDESLTFFKPLKRE